MTKHKFKVGEYIRVYDCSDCGDDSRALYCDGWIGEISTHGTIKLQENGKNWRGWFHPKQCRRLVKKKKPVGVHGYQHIQDSLKCSQMLREFNQNQKSRPFQVGDEVMVRATVTHDYGAEGYRWQMLLLKFATWNGGEALSIDCTLIKPADEKSEEGE